MVARSAKAASPQRSAVWIVVGVVGTALGTRLVVGDSDVGLVLGMLMLAMGSISLVVGIGLAARNLDTIAQDTRVIAEHLTRPPAPTTPASAPRPGL